MTRATWRRRRHRASSAPAAVVTLHAILSAAGQAVTLATAAVALWHTLTHKHPGGPR